MEITTDIIPAQPYFFGEKKTLDLKAICVFAATGFFLDQDTYYKEQKVLSPATHYQLDVKSQTILHSKPYFKWHYTPKERSFETVLNEFTDLFEMIIKEQSAGRRVILPLSGGLDSRTQAVAHSYLKIETSTYSYAFDGGHDETSYGKKIAEQCGFSFQAFTIPNGYLWDVIEPLAEILGGYSEFTHPRQMAILDSYAAMGEVFSLGHWGDVLFDDMGVSDNLSLDEQSAIILKKIVKKGGWEIAEALWQSWQLEGDFKTYFTERIKILLNTVAIPQNANAQIRAFKSRYWAPRWTSVNLAVFKAVKPIELPYYDHRMCEFICTVPERYLAGRQLQIAYIKKRMPELAKISWQAHNPFNLYSYEYNKIPWNVPIRILNKIKRLMVSKPYIQRNWELQFLGETNEIALKRWLFDTASMDTLIEKVIRTHFLRLFKEKDAIIYSHPVSILLTLALFTNKDEHYKLMNKPNPSA
ncbi:MAG: asparagine synthase-related protein [Aquaticitalea sp.]